MPALSEQRYQELHSALLAGEKTWRQAIEGLRDSGAFAEDEIERRERLLDELVAVMLPSYEARNRQAIEQLFDVLGLTHLYEGQGLDSVIDAAIFDGGWQGAAESLARANLGRMAADGHVFSNTYTREMISIGWRDAFLIATAEAGKADGSAMIERVINRGYPDLQSRAEIRPQLLQRTQAIGQSFGDLGAAEQWLVAQLDHGFWWTLLSAVKKGAKDGPVIGAQLFVTELENRLNAR
jgi:hypothetical protein